MTNHIKYSTKIREIRKRLDLTQSEFAEKLGIQQANLSAIELGKRNPTLEMIDALIHLFNISPEFIHLDKGAMFREEEPSKKEEDLEAIIDRKIKEALANIAS